MKRKIQSALFQEAASFTKEFHEHLAVLWEINKSKQDILLTFLPKMFQATTEGDRRYFQQEAVKKIGGDANNALQAISALQFIASKWNHYRDTRKDVLQDLELLKILPEKPDKKRIAIAFFKKYFDFLEIDGARRNKREHSIAILPSLNSLNTIIDYRVVLDSSFSWSNDNPNTYKPACSQTVPVIVVEIGRDEGDPIIFQCTPDGIEMMIKKLQATLKEYKLSRKLIK